METLEQKHETVITWTELGWNVGALVFLVLAMVALVWGWGALKISDMATIAVFGAVLATFCEIKVIQSRLLP
jgi:hypothetical protein